MTSPFRPALPALRVAAVLGLAAAMALGAGTPAVARTAPPPSCSSDQFDLVAGAPRFSESRGGVDVRLAGHSGLLTRSGIGAGTGMPGDEFGASIATDIPGQGCGLFAIGAPGADDKGAVYITEDSAEGVGHGPAVVVTAPAGAAGDRFGEAVALSRSVNSENLELWVGAPRRDVNGAVDAGVVEHYRLNIKPGADHLKVTHLGTVRQGMAAIPYTTAESGDRFGEVLASADDQGVIIGVPHEDIGTAKDAGMATRFAYDELIDDYSGRSLTQNDRHISGHPEAGDRFGAAVSANGSLIGIPGEDVGTVRDAGLVQEIDFWSSTTVDAGKAYSQDSPGVPGHNEAGDHFGAAVELAGDPEWTELSIGVPGEDVGSVRDAGVVVRQFVLTPDGPEWAVDRKGYGLPGTPKSGDALGSALYVHTLYGETSADQYSGQAVVGAPGDDKGSAVDVGAAYGDRLVEGDMVVRDRIRFSGAASAGLRFGSVFAKDVYGQPGD